MDKTRLELLRRTPETVRRLTILVIGGEKQANTLRKKEGMGFKSQSPSRDSNITFETSSIKTGVEDSSSGET
jgi:hypothetical protein